MREIWAGFILDYDTVFITNNMVVYGRFNSQGEAGLYNSGSLVRVSTMMDGSGGEKPRLHD